MIGAAKLAFVSNLTSTVQSFTSNSSWTAPAGITTANILLVGGGGGGGNVQTSGIGKYETGGGGGAGGYVYTTLSNIVPGTTYTITVGIGGASGNVSTGLGSNGAATVALGITARGGGGGGSGWNSSYINALKGASGGGGGFYSTTSPTVISGSAGTAFTGGYSGGTGSQNFTGFGFTTPDSVSGGGGGAGGVGGNGTVLIDSNTGDPTSYTLGTGGAGVYYSITGANVLYAVGGDGGVSLTTTSVAGSTNSAAGSGGRGGVFKNTSLVAYADNGVNGIVVIQYYS